MRKLTGPIINHIRSLRAEGKSYEAISKEVGLSYGTIQGVFKREELVEDTTNLEQILSVHKTRLKLSLKNEAKTGVVTISTERIAREVERLEKIIAASKRHAAELSEEADDEAGEVEENEEDDVGPHEEFTQDSLRKLLEKRSLDIEKLLDIAKEKGDLAKYSSIMRIANQLAMIHSRFIPESVSENDPDWVAAAEKCRNKLREIVTRRLAKKKGE